MYTVYTCIMHICILYSMHWWLPDLQPMSPCRAKQASSDKTPEDVEPPEDVETPESPEKPEQVKPPAPEMSLPAGLTASDIVDIPANQKPAKMGEVCKYMTWAWCNRGRNPGASYRKDGHPLCCFKGSLPVETPEETDAKLQFSTGFLCAQ